MLVKLIKPVNLLAGFMFTILVKRKLTTIALLLSVRKNLLIW
jgi:hypothetical protein